VARPGADVWLLYGDGSSAYSLAEFDTMVRQQIPVIAVVGTDGSWSQIAREQRAVLKDPVGTELLRTAYHTVVEGYGGRGFVVERDDQVDTVLREAQTAARRGVPVLVNVHIDSGSFRQGSISI
jgi:acetolactate synthase-1/2/3 large subunit